MQDMRAASEGKIFNEKINFGLYDFRRLQMYSMSENDYFIMILQYFCPGA